MYHPRVDALASPWVQALGIGVLALAMLGLLTRRYQHCPHCGRWVSRARRGWLRCRACGRQYHRSVRLRR
jgi:tRNA(Ile2) C34 agmatinyltransferase TiaS